MRKNYYCKRAILIFSIVLTAIANFTNAQTTHIDPTGDGGFQTGATFALNNWLTDTSGAAQNLWACGTGATAGFTGTRCAYISNTSTAVTPTHTYTVGPAVTKSAHMYRNITIAAGQTQIALSFNWVGYGELNYDMMKVWLAPVGYTPVYGSPIVASGAAPTGIVQVGLAQYNLQSTWAAANITLPTAYAGTSFRLIFEWNNDTSLGTQPPAGVDNISLISSLPPVCSSLPSTLVSSNITPTTATISWNAGVPAPTNGYEYYVSTSATAPVIGTIPTGTTAAGILTANLTGLVANTTYYYWVRSNCNGIDKGNWVGATFFTGYCASATSTSTTQYINNFTTIGGLSNINNSTGFSAGGYGNFTGLTVSEVAGQSISFSAAYTGGTFGLGIWVDWNNDLDFADAGETVYLSGGYNTANASTFAIPAGALVGNHRMRIRADYWSTSPVACGVITNGETEDYTLNVATPLPCSANPTALLSPTAALTTATISWTAAAPPPANGYQYYVSTSATTPAVGATPTGSTAAGVTSANLTGLTPNTTYYFWVRSNCGGALGQGSWVGPGTFFTGYCSSTSTDSFYYIDNFTTSGGFSNISNIGSGYSATGYGNFTTQSVSQVAGSNVNFSAIYFNGITYTYGFRIWVDWNNDLDFADPGELVYSPNTYAVSHAGSFNIPGATATGNYRMRIRANYLSTTPTPCGSITYGETEDYTLTVSNPLPCSSNPSGIVTNVTTSTTATISWNPAPVTPANGYQYYYSTSPVTPSMAATPSGSTTSAVVTANLTGLTTGATYYVWVRSNCGGAMGQGSWIGPVSFFIPACGIGNSTGTTTLGCPNVVSGGLGLLGADPPPMDCSTASCVDLEAVYLQIGQTTSYTVETIPYAPPYQFGCLKNPVSVNNDDVWSPLITLPFNFCYYGNSYNKCLISSNGAITFDLVYYAPGGYSGWSFAANTPSPTLFNNSIFGVYHDIDPSISGEVGYELITLNTGCRALVASWNNIPMFQCNSIFYTGMIVLYENTNIIDVYIKEKNVCTTWNGGNAIAGIQNNGATAGIAAPSRNGLDADWTVTNEAWRFVPSGSSITTINWYQGAGTAGPIIGTTDVISVCPAVTTVYTAEVTYTLCDGRTFVEMESTTVTVNKNKIWNGSVSTDWNTANNWTPVGIPDATNCVVVPNGTVNCIISGTNYNAYAYSVLVESAATLRVNAANNITVTDDVTVNTGGQFVIKNAASLVQINNVANTGVITMERITQPMYRYDYTYWGSPVTQASNFTLGMLSPGTQPDKYYSWTPYIGASFGTWNQESTASVMNPQKGYIVRAPNSFSTNIMVKAAYTANFIGTPNNGDITCPILYGTFPGNNDQYNLLGNPYPSAVSAASFLNYAQNASVIDGTIYFWTHNSPPSTAFPDPFYNDFITNYSAQDYASWNRIGGVGTMALSGGSVPNGFIAAGQSFFVRSLATPGNAIFRNTMRVTSNNSQFFRYSDESHSGTTEDDDFEKHRLWLNLTNDSGAFNQILVAYAEGATQGWDRGYDGIRFNDLNNITFYSIIPDNILVIQGRALPFNANDEVPLGYVSTLDGTFSIRIDHFDGLFETNNIYLEDKLLDIIHDIKQSPYNFTTAIGSFNDRFVLRYTNSSLSVYDVNATTASAFINDRKIWAAANENIASIDVYDISGKLVNHYMPKLSSRTFESDFMFSQGIYFAKIRLESGMTITQKLINQ